MGLLFVSVGAAGLIPGIVLALSFFATVLGIPLVVLSAFWLHAGARLLKGGHGPNPTSRWLGGIASLLLLMLLSVALSQLTSTDLSRQVAIDRWAQFRPFLLLKGAVAISALWYLALDAAPSGANAWRRPWGRELARRPAVDGS